MENINLEVHYLNNVAKELNRKWENILSESVIYFTEEIEKKFNLIINNNK
mgnify:CR=1 FL=1